MNSFLEVVLKRPFELEKAVFDRCRDDSLAECIEPRSLFLRSEAIRPGGPVNQTGIDSNGKYNKFFTSASWGDSHGALAGGLLWRLCGTSVISDQYSWTIGLCGRQEDKPPSSNRLRQG